MIDFNATVDELEVLATEYLNAACYEAFRKVKLSEVDSMKHCDVLRYLQGITRPRWAANQLGYSTLCGSGVENALRAGKRW